MTPFKAHVIYLSAEINQNTFQHDTVLVQKYWYITETALSIVWLEWSILSACLYLDMVYLGGILASMSFRDIYNKKMFNVLIAYNIKET